MLSAQLQRLKVRVRLGRLLIKVEVDLAEKSVGEVGPVLDRLSSMFIVAASMA